MNQDAMVKALQALVMFFTSFGIYNYTPEEANNLAVVIVAGAFGVLSLLSGFKAWMSKKQGGLIEPTNELNRLKIKGLKADVNASISNERIAKIKLTQYEEKYGIKVA